MPKVKPKQKEAPKEKLVETPAAVMEAGEFTLIKPEYSMVSIFDVYIGERRRKEMGDVADLAKDIRENGLLHPPTVRPPNEIERELGVTQPWVLVAGGRRFGALQTLGLLEIPVLTRETMDELKHRIIELHENLKRKQLTPGEESLMVEEIMQLRQEQATIEGKKVTRADVAIELGMHPSTMTRNIQAAQAIKANPELKKSKASRKAIVRAAATAEHARITVADVMSEQRAKKMQYIQKDVVCARAEEWIKKRATRSITLVATDPPFGIDYFSQGQKDEGQLSEYDDDLEKAKDFLTHMIPQWYRVLRETGWLISFLGEETYDFAKQLAANCCHEHFDYRWPNYERGQRAPDDRTAKRWSNMCVWATEHADETHNSQCRFPVPEAKPWIWFRPNSRNKTRYPEAHASNFYEKILVVNMGYGRLNYKCSNVITLDAEYGDERFHPNQKPVSMGKELTARVCMIGDTVMDTTFGSGALLAGAASRGMYVEGCDADDTWLGPAHGLIAKYMVGIPSNGRSHSEQRYLKLMNQPLTGLTDFSEVEDEE